MAGDRSRQPAREILSIECRFQQSKSRLYVQRGLCMWVSKRGIPLKSSYYPLLATCLLLWIGTDVLLIITSTGYMFLVVLSSMTSNDLVPPK